MLANGWVTGIDVIDSIPPEKMTGSARVAWIALPAATSAIVPPPGGGPPAASRRAIPARTNPSV
jgi:hypothetical protein